MDTYLNNKAIRDAWNNWLIVPDYKTYLTVTSSKTYSDNQFIEYVDQAVNNINRRIFGRKYRKHEDYIEGFCMFERHITRKRTHSLIKPKFISTSMMSAPLHAHLLIRDTEKLNNQLGDRDFESLILRDLGRIKHKTKGGNEYPVFDIKNGINMQTDIFDKGGLVNYVTKTARFDSDFGFVGILGVDGIEIGGSVKH